MEINEAFLSTAAPTPEHAGAKGKGKPAQEDATGSTCLSGKLKYIIPVFCCALMGGGMGVFLPNATRPFGAWHWATIVAYYRSLAAFAAYANQPLGNSAFEKNAFLLKEVAYSAKLSTFICNYLKETIIK